MRLALFALLFALPLTACDPDATPAADPPVLEAEPGGDTGLPDTLMAPDRDPAEVMDEGTVGDTGLPDTLSQ